ncbi:hypothetical protein [Shewanella sp. FJAT-52076]|uniref:hypothetical protein n=1 Tax=Shewanella sp. FJAT-52076 TaxID=2864202 RepID=UPI001C65A8CC|nr:hypothetical protein [Shewanella sp. FJAT-52076]QYJ76428.1 hypothetical protein K0H79_05515 [Shewanella sp. FJAT-52076]
MRQQQAYAERENDDELYPCSCRLMSTAKIRFTYSDRAFFKKFIVGVKNSKKFFPGAKPIIPVAVPAANIACRCALEA